MNVTLNKCLMVVMGCVHSEPLSEKWAGEPALSALRRTAMQSRKVTITGSHENR